RDIIVVASVSCIYGMGNPTELENGTLRLHQGQTIGRNTFLHSLVNSQYMRTTAEFTRGSFRVQGDTVDINLPYVDYGYRITFFGDEIEEIESFDTDTGQRIPTMEDEGIFPATLYLAPQGGMQRHSLRLQDTRRRH